MVLCIFVLLGALRVDSQPIFTAATNMHSCKGRLLFSPASVLDRFTVCTVSCWESENIRCAVCQFPSVLLGQREHEYGREEWRLLGFYAVWLL
jgi:hypothetical protein